MTGKDEFVFYKDTEAIKSPLQFSPGETIAEYLPAGASSSSEIRVCGDVRIKYKGAWYGSYNRFPQELKDAVDRGEDLRDRGDCFVDTVSRFELFVKRGDETFGGSWVVNIEGMPCDDAKNLLREHYEYVLENKEECQCFD